MCSLKFGCWGLNELLLLKLRNLVNIRLYRAQEFPYPNDTVYFSHCYPYTYTDLLTDLDALVGESSGALTPTGRALCVKRETLCETLAGNTCFLVSIDDPRVGPIGTGSRRESLRSAAGEASSISASGLNSSRRSSLEKAASNGYHPAATDYPTLGPEKLFDGSAADPRDLNKRVVIVTARVHPGEPNSSWMMKGLLEFLASPHYIAQVYTLPNTALYTS